MKPLMGIVLGLWVVFQPCFAEDWRDEIGAQMKEAEKFLYDTMGVVEGLTVPGALRGQWTIEQSRQGKGYPAVIEFINARKVRMGEQECSWVSLSQKEVRYALGAFNRYAQYDTPVKVTCEGMEPVRLYADNQFASMGVDFNRTVPRKFKVPEEGLGEQLKSFWQGIGSNNKADREKRLREHYENCLENHDMAGMMVSYEDKTRVCGKEMAAMCNINPGTYSVCFSKEIVKYHRELTPEEIADQKKREEPLKKWGNSN